MYIHKNYYVRDTLCDLSPILSEDEINAAPIDMQREIKSVKKKKKKKTQYQYNLI